MFIRIVALTLLVLFSARLVAADTVYYTQHNLWLFKGKSATTNYAVDVLVPVNSQVKLDDEDGDELELILVEGGLEFTVVNIEKHSKQSIEEIKRRLLAEQPVALSQFSKLGQEGIKQGEVKLGMSKAEVLVARGYPPGVATLNTDSDSWKYWHNKFNTKLVQFENGKVTNIKD